MLHVKTFRNDNHFYSPLDSLLSPKLVFGPAEDGKKKVDGFSSGEEERKKRNLIYEIYEQKTTRY